MSLQDLLSAALGLPSQDAAPLSGEFKKADDLVRYSLKLAEIRKAIEFVKQVRGELKNEFPDNKTVDVDAFIKELLV